MTPEEVLREVQSVWEAHFEQSCLIHWDLFKSPQFAANLILSLGVPVVAKICHRLAKDHRFTRSGFPDLIVWNPDKRISKIVEVKGPNDRLSTKQILWLEFLLDCGSDAVTCHVEAIGAKKMKADKSPAKKHSSVNKSPAKKNTSVNKSPAKKHSSVNKSPAKKDSSVNKSPAKKHSSVNKSPAKKYSSEESPKKKRAEHSASAEKGAVKKPVKRRLSRENKFATEEMSGDISEDEFAFNGFTLKEKKRKILKW